MMDLRKTSQSTVIVDSPESIDWAQYGYLRKESGEWYMPICECIAPVVYDDDPEHLCRTCGLLVWNTEEEVS